MAIAGVKKNVIIDPRSISWKKIKKNVFRKDLSYDKASGMYLSLITIKSHTRLARHMHPHFEWVYVIKGLYQDDRGTVPEGQIKINAQESVHTSYSKSGCTLLVYWCGHHILVREK